MTEPELITSPERLTEICKHLLNEPVIAADTEFFWERTFYPILGLVQLATASGECYLIDTVLLSDLTPLAPVLAAKSVVKILHDAPQDLGILAKAAGSDPSNIFDTRLAAGFAGFESTCSLQNLLKETLNIDLPKSETRSNWIKRPLTDAQLQYAADDVLHLPALRDYLINACSSETALEWLNEECSLLDKPDAWLDRDPRTMYQRVKGSSRLNPVQLAILRELTAWREIKARRRDLPRGRILRDPVLIELSRNPPRDFNAVKRIADFPKKMPIGVVTELLEAIQQGIHSPEAEWPKPAESEFANRQSLKSKTKLLLKHIREKCEIIGIDPALAASRADAESFILNRDKENAPELKLNRGWRKEIVADFDTT